MMKKRLMIALCCLVLLMQLLPIVPMAETASTQTVDKGTTIPQELYYCRTELSKLPNGKALVEAYDRIVEGINQGLTDIEIQLTKEEFNLVFDATRRDHTEQFWVDSTYGTTPDRFNENIVDTFHPEYTISGKALTDAKVAFEEAVKKFLNRLTPDMSEYEMEKALHDMIATHVVYTTGAPNAHNAYGALVEGVAVCEGYAESLQYLLQRVGIQSVEILGYGTTDLETGKGENHAWNIVRIDGKYYYVDLTWDDHGEQNFLSYAYFNQNGATFNVDHEAWVIGYENGKDWDGGFDFPECNSLDANYYQANNLRFDSYNVNMIAELLKNNKLSVTLFVEGDVDAFVLWYNSNIQEIAKAAGVNSSFSYGHVKNRNEVRIVIETCGHTQLEAVEAKAATCTEDGNTAYYICKNEECGKWFSDAAATLEISNKDLVKVLSSGHNWVRKEDASVIKDAESETYWYTCSTCNTVSDTLFFGPEPEAPAFDLNAIIDFLLANPLILGGGGGGILLIVIIAIIRKIRG